MRPKRILLALTCAWAIAAVVGSRLLYAQETVTLPEDIGSYEHVSSMVILDEKSPLFGIHHSYLHPRWMKAFQQLGPYREGTVFVGKLYRPEKDEQLENFLFEGEFVGYSSMRKDKKAERQGAGSTHCSVPTVRGLILT